MRKKGCRDKDVERTVGKGMLGWGSGGQCR